MSTFLKKHLDREAMEIEESLRDNSLSYFEVGLNLYIENNRYPGKSFQPIIGNFSIAVELLLKAIVANKMFSFLYPSLSKEAQVILQYPESLPTGTLPNLFINDLRTFSIKSIDINQAISFFYQLFPDKKQEYKSHLSLISSIRNVAVHGAFPSFQKYFLERTAYISCKLFLMLKDDDLFTYFQLNNNSVIQKIIDDYDDRRNNKVHSAIKQAKTQTKKLDFLYSIISGFDDWNSRTEDCPVCKNEATVYGYSEEVIEDNFSSLFFYKDYFECHECGLILDDSLELEMAGIESNEDISQYLVKWQDYQSSKNS